MIQPTPDLFPPQPRAVPAHPGGSQRFRRRRGVGANNHSPLRLAVGCDLGIIYDGFARAWDCTQVVGKERGPGSQPRYGRSYCIAREDVKIVVVGSSNMDLVVKSSRIPVVGETVLGGDFIMVPGGKGANQAVAAAKLGARVHFVARLGNDMFGRRSLENLAHEELDTTYVTLTSDASSGVALITVDERGDNAIVVAPGANALLSVEDVRRAEAAIRSAGALVAQLEVPLKTVQYAAQIACDAGVPFILDPAPAQELPPELLRMVDVLTPNESEAEMLTGIEVSDESSAYQAAARLLASGVKAIIVTMGSKGFLLADAGATEFVPALRVRAVDATAAGDAFAGSLAVELARGQPLRAAAVFAGRVAALSVTKMGAQPSMPSRKEVEEFCP